MPKRAMTEKSLPPFDLKAAREARGLNQSQVAEILCASQASVARWEADGNVPLIYRKYWDLYWSIQKSAKATKRAKAPNVTATADAKHE